MDGGSCPLITHERTRDVNADAESGGGDAPQCNSVFLFPTAAALLSVNSVIHGLIILTCAEVGDSKAAHLLVLCCAS